MSVGDLSALHLAGAAIKDFNWFWEPRFMVEMPPSLTRLVMPWLDEFQQVVAKVCCCNGTLHKPQLSTVEKGAKRLWLMQMGKGAPTSAKGLAFNVFPVLALVLIQDSLELAEIYPDNRVHQLLLQDPSFQALLQEHKSMKVSGVRCDSMQHPPMPMTTIIVHSVATWHHRCCDSACI